MKFFPLLITLLSSIVVFSQNRHLGDANKCYEKAYLDAQYFFEVYEETYPILIDKNRNDIETEIITLTISPPKETWRKVITTRSSKSLMGIYSERQEEINIIIVKDTTDASLFVWETFEVIDEKSITQEKEASSQWVEVVCSKSLKRKHIREIQNELRDQGLYSNVENENKITEEIIDALIKFQKSKNLPYGRIDLKTLEALEVSGF